MATARRLVESRPCLKNAAESRSLLFHYPKLEILMKRIRLYRHSDCAKCAKLAKMHHRLDWLNRFEDSTATPSSGPVRMGQIVVQDLASGVVYGGIECFRLLCRNIPAYWPIIPLTYFPFIRRMIEKDIGGECGGACDI